MPTIFLAVPVAAALAWWLLKGGPMRRERRAQPFTGDVGGALAPGGTGQLGDEEEPFKRRELPRERPSMTGGEYGGPYGEVSGEGGDESVYADSPGPTQTSLLGSGFVGVPPEIEALGLAAQWQANVASYPTQIPGAPIPVIPDPTQGVIPYGGVTSAPAAPTHATPVEIGSSGVFHVPGSSVKLS